jgi:hypothetical protein
VVVQCYEVVACLPCLLTVQKAANLVREHSGSKAVLRIEVAGKAMLRVALGLVVEVQSQ